MSPINQDKFIVLNFPIKSQKQKQKGFCYHENNKEMQTIKLQEILSRHRHREGSEK